MLARFRYRRDFRIIARCLADKPSDPEQPVTEPEAATKSKNETKKADGKSIMNSEKMQMLLKNMLIESKIKESEYREKFTTAPDLPKRQKLNEDEIEIKTEKIEENLTKAAGKVAEVLGGDVKQTEAELLSRVLGKINQTSTNLSDLLLGMKVDRTKESDEVQPETRGQQVKRIIARPKREEQTGFVKRKEQDTRPRERMPRTQQAAMQIDIFSGEPLGILNTKDVNYGTRLDVWDQLKQRELELSITQPPANYFQKMALWTKQGKVWKFPIDNEQGLDEEQKVHFSEHIFVDSHLEDWCPKRGPIRHFMELVCVGLSKNAFYTVQEKKDHIQWYKEYFESKKDLLTEIGAWDVAKKDNSEASL